MRLIFLVKSVITEVPHQNDADQIKHTTYIFSNLQRCKHFYSCWTETNVSATLLHMNIAVLLYSLWLH